MASQQQYNNYQLYRTTPLVFGDMMLDLVLDWTYPDIPYLFVKDAHIRPISEWVGYNRPSGEYILNRPHQMNVKDFYLKTRDTFYESNIDPDLKSDWPVVVPKGTSNDERKYMKNWDDTYWAGTRRMSYQLYGTTHGTMMPFWLEDCQALRLHLFLGRFGGVGGSNTDFKYTIVLAKDRDAYGFTEKEKEVEIPKFHQDFCNYLCDYLEYVGLAGGNNDVVTMNIKSNTAYIRGLDCDTGAVRTVQDLHICRNILYRERPLLETNSLISSGFKLHELVPCQSLCLNLCYDIQDIIQAQYLKMVANTPNIIASSSAECQRKNGSWENITKGDIYTNHEYVPRPKHVTSVSGNAPAVVEDDGLDFGQGPNALDYKMDHKVTALAHKNRITQPVCHWAMTNEPNMLWNVYDGFGSWSKNKNGELIIWGHGWGDQTDTNSTNYNNGTSSSQITKFIGDGDQIAEVLGNPQKYFGTYLANLSGYVNGNKFGYGKENTNWPDLIYAGLATTPPYSSVYKYGPGTREYVLDKNTAAIWSCRYGPNGEDNLPDTTNEETGRDLLFDVAYGHDMDNRFAKYIAPNSSKDDINTVAAGGSLLHRMKDGFRMVNNCYGLFVSMDRRMMEIDGVEKDVLSVIFWTPTVTRDRTDPVASKVIYADHTDSELIVSNISTLLRKYYNRYIRYITNPDGSIKSDPDIPPIMGNIPPILSALSSVEGVEVVFFNRTITHRSDVTLSPKASELNLYKLNGGNAYVFRHSDKIRPAIFTPGAERITGDPNNNLSFRKFGRNFLYLKDMHTAQEFMNIYPEYMSNVTIQDGYISGTTNPEGGEVYICRPPVKTRYNSYIGTNVPPVYKSLNYDSIHRLKTNTYMDTYTRSEQGDDVIYTPGDKYRITDGTGEYVSTKNLYGDLMYTEPLYSLYGIGCEDGVQYPENWSQLPEFKWFDQSRVSVMDDEITGIISVMDDKKASMENAALEMIQGRCATGRKYVDLVYIKNIYNIKYDFIEMTSGGLYKYKVTATLK